MGESEETVLKEPMSGPRRVLTYGTFDTFHWGHIELLRRAKELSNGGELIVALSTDEFNSTKGKKAYHSYNQRYKMLRAIRYVDIIIPEKTWAQKIDDVRLYDVDCVVMGADWEGDEHFEILRPFCEVAYLGRTDFVSSTDIRKLISTLEIRDSEKS